MNKSPYISLALIAALTAGGVGMAFAKSSGTNGSPTEQSDALKLAALADAKVSITDAIAIAEKDGGGKAVDAGFADENGSYAYEVEVLDTNGEQTVLVDAQSGKVTKVAQKANDNDDQDEGDTGAEDEGSESGEDND